MKESLKPLGIMPEGGVGRVAELRSSGPIRRRLQDMGIIEGTLVKCLHISPSGDPAAFLVRGAVIAIRNDVSSDILVEGV